MASFFVGHVSKDRKNNYEVRKNNSFFFWWSENSYKYFEISKLFVFTSALRNIFKETVGKSILTQQDNGLEGSISESGVNITIPLYNCLTFSQNLHKPY